MILTSLRLTVLAFTLLATTTAGAAEQDDSPDDDSKSYSWGLGLAGIRQQAYTGIDRDNIAVPLIYFENRWLQLFGPFLDIKAPGIKWSDEQELSFTGRIAVLRHQRLRGGRCADPERHGGAQVRHLRGPHRQMEQPVRQCVPRMDARRLRRKQGPNDQARPRATRSRPATISCSRRALLPYGSTRSMLTTTTACAAQKLAPVALPMSPIAP